MASGDARGRAARDARGRAARERMVEALRETGISDEAVLGVLGRVERHRFIDRFWSSELAAKPGSRRKVRELHVGPDPTTEVLDAIYAPQLALGISEVKRGGVPTVTISAPVVVAQMLSELELEPGMKVLEIGTGSGYNAACLAEMVGDPGLVSTVDIEPGVVSAARAHFDALGLGSLAATATDGDLGWPGRGPFDRIVATVGCNDLSPAWAEQLTPQGRILAPVTHGGSHPRVRVSPRDGGLRDGCLVGAVVGPSQFVAIRGRQAEFPGRTAGPPLSPPGAYHAEPLPQPIRAALEPGKSSAPAERLFWGLGLYVALRDLRASGVISVVEGTSAAAVDPYSLQFLTTGDNGSALRQRLEQLAFDWVHIGRPALGHFQTEWTPITSVTPQAPEGSGEPSGPWIVSRMHYNERVTLSTAPCP